jgi:RNA polymerase sigma-70 factor (ECF subfamily)
MNTSKVRNEVSFVDEQDLIDGLIAGQTAAIEHLCRQYQGRILAVVRPLVKDEWDAEEVAQDVLMKVCDKIDTFRGNSALWSWMYRIAVNEARMKTRKYKRHPVPIEDDTLYAIRHREEDGDFDQRPDEHLAGKQILAQIAEFLDGCNDKNTLVYLDLEWKGRDREEVAHKLDLTEAAVKTRLHRVRVSLREQIEQNYLLASA